MENKDYKEKVVIGSETFLSQSAYSKETGIPVKRVQSWIRQGNFDSKDTTKVARVIYAHYVKQNAKPVFQRKHKSRA